MLIFIFTFQENYGNIFLVNNHWVYSLERILSAKQLTALTLSYGVWRIRRKFIMPCLYGI